MKIDELTEANLTTAPANYAAGEAELEAIAQIIERGEIPIDKLSVAIRRADVLNTYLEAQLLKIEQELKPLAAQQPQGGEAKVA